MVGTHFFLSIQHVNINAPVGFQLLYTVSVCIIVSGTICSTVYKNKQGETKKCVSCIRAIIRTGVEHKNHLPIRAKHSVNQCGGSRTF